MIPPLSALEEERYARQLLVPELADKQERLRAASALVVGAGGLASPILYYLVGAGVGHIGIVDDDVVGLSNLPRQILYTSDDLGSKKAHTAATRLKKLNPHSQIHAHATRLSPDNALELCRGYDLIIDACDNLATRYLMDDTARHLHIAYLYGAVEGFVGQASLFLPDSPLRYRDLYPSYDEERDRQPVGVVAPSVGVVASLMAVEALKYLASLPTSLSDRLLLIDTLSLSLETLDLRP